MTLRRGPSCKMCGTVSRRLSCTTRHAPPLAPGSCPGAARRHLRAPERSSVHGTPWGRGYSTTLWPNAERLTGTGDVLSMITRAESGRQRLCSPPRSQPLSPPQAQWIGSDTPIETSCRCRSGFVAEGNDEALVGTEQLSPPPSANAGLGNDAPLSTGSVHHVSTCGQGPNPSSTEMCPVPGTRCRRRPAGFRYVVRRPFLPSGQ